MELTNTFLGGKMDLDSDSRLVANGTYRNALNIRVINSEGSDAGAVEKTLSNKQMTFLSFGDNVKTIGSISDEFDEIIYYLVKDDDSCAIIEYNVATETAIKVIDDTENILNLHEDYPAQMGLIVDTDNDNRLLLFTDYRTQPKCINIERAKTYTTFTEEMVLLIKKPPLDAPTIVLGNTTEEENNISEKFISFAYRYKYLDNEYSALSPFSQVALLPESFRYDYSTGENESMVNAYNKADITVNTGSDLVTDIEICFKESGSNSIYVIGEINKAEKDDWITPNVNRTFTYSGNKIFKVLPEKELYRLYDNVPLLAKAMCIHDNIVFFTNYIENYDIVNGQGVKIPIKFTLDKVSTAITTPIGSLKSNRDYEVAIAYVDDYGRMTTPLDSEFNTIYIPPADSVTQNQIKVTVESLPPYWAKKFRFFVKQTKPDYESLAPVIFYQDGGYRWVRLEQADKDKVKENDYLIVKSDSSGVLNSLVKVKVLEVERKEKNFLQPEDVTTTIEEQAGLYMKIKPDGFRLNLDDYYNFTFNSLIDSASNHDNPIINTLADIDEAHFYGTGLNDMTSGGTCTLGNKVDARYEITINTVGTPDTFDWTDGTTSGTNVAITGAAQSLSNGVTVTFGATTGHIDGDEWKFYARGTINTSENRAYGLYRINGDIDETMTTADDTRADEVIKNGASITLKYGEADIGQDQITWELNKISSSSYDNITEWFYEENVGAAILSEIQTEYPSYDISKIYFVRGKLVTRNGQPRLEYNADGYMTMVMESQLSETAMVLIGATTEIYQSNGTSGLLIETDPTETNSDIFFEIGKTYDITNGYHVGGAVNQASTADGEFLLPVFNCFAWGNGFESYKIRDKFNAKSMKVDTRPSTTIDNYKQNTRKAYVTYSNNYEQTTNYNALNEFNLGLANFKILDDRYGSVQAIVSTDTDIDVYQEDKVHQLMYKKSITYNRDGSPNVEKSNEVLGDARAHAGEYGISTNPESLVLYGNYSYWADRKRGVILRKGQSGIETITYGLTDWFRDILMTNPKIIGGFDPYFGQYVISIDNYTLTFDEKNKGWTSFHSFLPDNICRVNNRFFTVKDGQVYLHNEGDSVNNFYGVQYSSIITPILKDKSITDLIYKTIKLDGLYPWKATVKTNLTESVIYAEEFDQDESKWESFIRKNENEQDFTGTTQGVGLIVGIGNKSIFVADVPNMVSNGDILYQLNGSTPEVIGTITAHTKTSITVDAFVVTPVNGRFCFSKKDSRIEGSEIRGIYAEVELEDTLTIQNELFSVSLGVIKS